MSWIDDFMPLAEMALRQQDLRHRYLHAAQASKVLSTPGIAWSFETTIVLGVYESALGKGYRQNSTVDYERAYPKAGKKNPKRADLAFKDPGKGKNWCYVEVKYYGGNGKQWVGHDIKKLKSIKLKSQRWMFIYRVRPNGGKSQSLDNLLKKNFAKVLSSHKCASFPTVCNSGVPGVCDLCLVKVS